MPELLSPARLGAWLHPGARVYWPGCAGHSPLFAQWLHEAPGLAAGVWFCGMWIPGVNRFDPTALHADARASSFFLSPDWHAGWQRGALDHLPLHYLDAQRWLATPGRFDVLLLHLAPPDADGRCSMGLAADFTPGVLAAADAGVAVLAHVNPRLPRTSAPGVPVERITAWVEAAAPPLSLHDAAPDDALRAVARQVAALVRDGDTLQFGLGRLQGAVLAELRAHRGLRVHAGMVSDGLLGLLHSGALAPLSTALPPVCAGVALGSPALYAAVSDAALMRFAPVEHTHAAATLAATPKLVAINSALEVDLLGQVNCETLDGRQVSGVGGLVDFLRGARASPGGRGIVAATATVGRGSRSRIVVQLPAGPVGVARGDVDHVVTEHGVAALRGLGVDARARALIAIADPAQRPALEEGWHTLRRTL
jgi:acyl-CoA hydrolase